jgi:hypothetical protein
LDAYTFKTNQAKFRASGYGLTVTPRGGARFRCQPELVDQSHAAVRDKQAIAGRESLAAISGTP